MRDRGLIDLRQIWRFGISGDKPIVLVHIHSIAGKGLVDTLLRAQPWWGFGGVACDLVVLNGEPNSYQMPLQREIEALRARVAQQTQNSFPRNDAAGFYLLRDHEVAPSEKAALSSLARAVFTADGRSLEMQVAALREAAASAGPAAEDLGPRVPLSVLAPAAEFADAVTAPQGGFDARSGEFRFEIDLNRRTARPWINVIANASFGFQVSESGTGYTWAVNSRQHQLTPWSNDPVQDPAFEHYLLQDLDSHELLPLTPAGRGGAAARHRVRHGQGYTVFECLHRNMVLETTFFADRDERIKLVLVQGAQRRHRHAPAARARDGRVAARRGARRAPHRPHLEARGPAGGVRPAARIERAASAAAPAFLALAGLDGPIAMDLRAQRILRRARRDRGARNAGPARRQRPRRLRRGGRGVHARRRRGRDLRLHARAGRRQRSRA